MHATLKLAAKAAVIVALIAGALGAAQARRPEPNTQGEASRGVIILPDAKATGLAQLRAGDTPALAGTRVKVEMADPEVGLLVSSVTLGDAELARALVGAGIAAEVNHPRHILPITPTAELFSTPQATRPEDLPNRPDFWHVEQIGADIVHHTGITGTASLIVGVIDTGVYTRHPLLGSTVLPGYDFVDSDPEPDDQVGHGTHVAGIVHSICPRCSILPVKVLDYYGGDDYTIARGIRYARQRGARIIQISLGGPAPSVTMCQAVRAVEAQGAQVVIAAGNSAGSDTWALGYPALCSPASLVVSATDRYDVAAWFSNYGAAVDLAAPGYRVWSAIPPSEYDEDGLYPASGTSMAAPQVSGAAALLWSENTSWTATQIRDRLLATARDISVLPGIDDGYGPRVDIAQAFGLRSRPIVVGMSVDKPWTPRQGSDQERTVQVRAQVRGDALSTVRLAVTIGSATQQLSMTLQGGDTYGLSYIVPRNTAHRRQILMQVVASNSAGPTYGGQEIVEQDGGPLPPPVIRILNGPPRKARPVEFVVEWPGAWNNFDFYCGDYESSVHYYTPKGQTITCAYRWEGGYVARAQLYNNFLLKEYAEVQVVVRPPFEVFLPIVRGRGL
jgi:subtilisin family serine protease